MRRRFFGGSARNSSSSHKERDGKPDRTSKDSSSSPLLPGASPTLKDSASDKERDAPATVGSRHRRNKNSVDTKPAERLSIFGGSFANTLGKSRKPPPRYDRRVNCTTEFAHVLLVLRRKNQLRRLRHHSAFPGCTVASDRRQAKGWVPRPRRVHDCMTVSPRET